MPPELLGPFALTAGLAVALGVLWREHLKADVDDRLQRDKALAIAQDQVEANNRAAARDEALAKEVGRLAASVAALAREQQGIRRDMAARRRSE